MNTDSFRVLLRTLAGLEDFSRTTSHHTRRKCHLTLRTSNCSRGCLYCCFHNGMHCLDSEWQSIFDCPLIVAARKEPGAFNTNTRSPSCFELHYVAEISVGTNVIKPSQVVWLKIEHAFFLVFISFFFFLPLPNNKCKPLLDNTQSTPGSSIWILEDYCILFYSAIRAFLSLAETCVLTRKTRVLSQKPGAREILEFSAITWLRLYGSLLACCSGSPVGVLLFCYFFLVYIFLQCFRWYSTVWFLNGRE